MGTNAAERVRLVERAKASASRSDWANAAQFWRDCLRAFPAEGAAYAWRVGLATALWNAARLDEAEVEFRTLAETPERGFYGFAGLARLAEKSGDLELALQRWMQCLNLFPESPAVPRWRALRAGALLRLGRLDEAEAEFSALKDEPAPESPVLAGLARLAAKRGEWALAERRWTSCLAAFPDAPAANGWRRDRAVVLERAGRWLEAREAWGTLADADAAVRAACCRFEAEGANEATEAEARRALESQPSSIRALRLVARLASARADWREALRLYIACAELEPLQLEHYASGVLEAVRAEDDEGAARLIAMAPPSLAEDAKFRARAVLPQFKLRGDVTGGLRFLNTIPETELDPSSAVAVGSFLRQSHRFDALEAFAARMLERFPGAPALIAFHLTSLYWIRGRDAFDVAKGLALSSLAEDAVIEVLRGLNPAWLSPAEARRMVDVLFARDPKGAAAQTALAKLAFRGEASVLYHIKRRLEGSEFVGGRILARMFSATIEDRNRIGRTCLGGVTWSDFAAAHEALVADVARMADEEGFPQALKSAFAAVLDAEGRCAFSWGHSIDSYFAAASFAHWLADRVRRRVPTSVLRIGDGEGNFLPYLPEHAPFQEADQDDIQHIWWGQVHISGGETEALSAALREALFNADALGTPPMRRLLKEWSISPSGATTLSHHWRGLIAATHFVETMPAQTLRRKALTSCHIHTDLIQWDLYRQIFAGLGSVSVVSCHDLVRVLAEKFGLDVRVQYRIPSEFITAGMWGAHGVEPAPFYPDLFHEIMDTVTPRLGEVYLVAAGFLGKLICDRIRARGGIGIDIGSAADLWVGHQTRFGTTGDLDFDLAASLIADQPFPDAFAVPRAEAGAACHSDDTRRRDVYARLRALGAPEPQSGPRLLRVIGHPRCGSHYTAVVLSRLGLAIGHERLGDDGICAWMHAVNDDNPPYAAPPSRAADFAVTLAYVRDPETAIPSIVVENDRNSSFAYRRFHIARRLGIDIARHREPIARAVDAYLAWMDIVAGERPLAILRVESLIDDLVAKAAALSVAGVKLDLRERAAAQATPKTVNATEVRGSAPKPSLPDGWRRALPQDLREKLDGFCAAHGYGRRES